MSNTLALLAALFWGFAAFAGGQAARRSHLFSVLVLDQILAALFSIPFAFFIADEFLLRDFLIGGASGLFGSAGVAFFYLGLRTNMVTVAPIAGVAGAFLPLGACPGGTPLSLAATRSRARASLYRPRIRF